VADQTPTPAQLRESAGFYTGLAVALRQFPDPWTQNEATHAARAAAALEEQAARLEVGYSPRESAIARAVELMTLAAQRVAQPLMPADTMHYDGADCDGQCLADDLESAAQELLCFQPTTELRGWGVMRPDGTLMPCYSEHGHHARAIAVDTDRTAHRANVRDGHRAVPVRLMLDDTQSAADAQEGRTDGN
jgi:hypothetical protein